MAGFGGAPNMGSDARGRRHPSAAWLKAGREAGNPLGRGRKLVVQIVETFGDKMAPTFVETLDSLRLAESLKLDLPPVMIYGDDVSHIVTEEGIANLLLCRTPAEREQAIRGVAGFTEVGTRPRPGDGGAAAGGRDHPAARGSRHRSAGRASEPAGGALDPRADAPVRQSVRSAGPFPELVGMHTLHMRHEARARLPGTRGHAIVGVVGSGNLEVLLERVLPGAECEVVVATPVGGYDAIWRAVVASFVDRASPGGLRISINDGGARPDTVSLAAAAGQRADGGRLMRGVGAAGAASWLQASARERIDGLLDPGSFAEFLPPTERVVSPHLAAFDLPVAFDDGMVVGRGTLDGAPVLVAAQEGQFLGGTFGEVSGAKLVGLLRAAAAGAGGAVLLLLDSGGVRLQEANAGELAVAEIMRAIAASRAAGIAVVALVGGRAGAFGGAGLIAASCGKVVVSAPGRIGVTGPEVIETNKGVEEFDSRDRALVWRIVGGRSRRLLGGADAFVPDSMEGFRDAARAMLARCPALHPGDAAGGARAARGARVAAGRGRGNVGRAGDRLAGPAARPAGRRARRAGGAAGRGQP